MSWGKPREKVLQLRVLTGFQIQGAHRFHKGIKKGTVTFKIVNRGRLLKIQLFLSLNMIMNMQEIGPLYFLIL